MPMSLLVVDVRLYHSKSYTNAITHNTHTHGERDAQNIHRNGHTYVLRQRYNRPKTPTFRLSRAKQRVIYQRTTHKINSQTTNLIDHRSRLACFGFYCYVEKSYWFLAPIIQSVAFVLLPCISHPLFSSLAYWQWDAFKCTKKSSYFSDPKSKDCSTIPHIIQNWVI